MGMAIQLRSYYDFWPYERPHPRKQIALTVVSAVCDHRAMQTQRDGIDGSGLAQLLQNLVT